MKILSWNCRGLGDAKASLNLKKLINLQKPDVVFLCETKLLTTEMKRKSKSYGFDECICVPCSNRTGGLAMLIRDDWSVILKGSSLTYIDTMIETNSEGSFRATGFYGEPELRNRQNSWTTLKNLYDTSNDPWLVFGDFNEILHDGEKSGRNKKTVNQMENFGKVINECQLNDLNFRGPWYTWSNKRGLHDLVRERLDRFLSNSEWFIQYPLADVEHLAWSRSNHCPIILSTEDKANKGRPKKKRHRFKFEKSWLSNMDCKKLVWKVWEETSNLGFNRRINKIGKELHQWHSIHIGELSRKINRLQSELANLKLIPPSTQILEDEKRVEENLSKAIIEEEEYWAQRARQTWLKEGDRNTKFYHAQASARRKINKIIRLKNERDEWVETEDDIQQVATSYFESLFMSQATLARNDITNIIPVTVNDEMNNHLEAEFTKEEVKIALFQMHPSKAPGPDGMSAMFYQHYWEVLEKDITELALGLIRGDIDIGPYNKTHIVLIPKGINPSKMQDFRPISLCNVCYKVVSKMLVNRMKTILPHCISKNQSAFVQGRQITDNTIIAYELIHELNGRKKGKDHHFALKLDMSKAYDRVEWNFVGNMMKAMGFNHVWIEKIIRCISSVTFSVLINGDCTKEFKPYRGLRQGDPLSPYLFLICAEGLSALLSARNNNAGGLGLAIGTNGPRVSHLFFANDSILFAKANIATAKNIVDILHSYELNSGQKINYDKSSLFFSDNNPAMTQVRIQRIFQIRSVTNPEKYLGLPTLIGRNKRLAFKEVVDRVRTKVKGWAKKFLSIGGREVFIKAVLQAIPMYTMQCFMLPKALCTEISRVIRKFWWYHKEEKRGINWMKWKKVCKPKAMGGVGFRDLHLFNTALIAKQGWRLQTNTNTLCYKVMRARYFPSTNFMEAKKGTKTSFLWKSLLQGRRVLEKGSIWRVENGKSINIHKDNWLPSVNCAKVTSMNQNFERNAKVFELIRPNGKSWNGDLIDREFDQYEANIIKNIPLLNANTDDKFTWNHSTSGRYTVKTGYYCLLEEDLEKGPHRNIWKQIWNSKVAPKIKLCAWKLCNSILPTAGNLNIRIHAIDKKCAKCGAEMEDSMHAVRTCPIAASTLKLCGFAQDIYEKVFTDQILWLEFAARNISATQFDLLLTAIWLIWTERNAKLFRGAMDNDIRMAERIKAFHVEYIEANIIEDSTPSIRWKIKWKPPEEDVIKVNFDASFNHITQAVGAGIIARDHDGFVMGSASFMIGTASSATMAEAMVARKALKFAHQSGFFNIVLEGDSLNVIKALRNEQQDFSYFEQWIEACKHLSSFFRSISYSFTKRDGNKAANELAKLATNRITDCFLMKDYPPEIHNIVMSDTIHA